MAPLTVKLLTVLLFHFIPVPNDGAARIVGGYDSYIWMYPYIASLQFEGSHICGAAIITENVLVSAAHCIRYAATEYSVRVGSTNSNEGGEIEKVADIKVHPQYDRLSGDYDICVIFLKQNLIFDGFTVRAVDLPSPEDAVIDDQTVWVSGWGTTKAQDASLVSLTLKAANLQVVERERCRTLFPPNSITDNMLCAQSRSKTDDACNGDSGGPMTTLQGKLVGIVSWGMSCADVTPGVYTDVLKLKPFITGLVQV